MSARPLLTMCVAVIAILVAGEATPAAAADANGTIVFQRTDFQGLGDGGLKAVNADGSGLRTLAAQANAFST